MKILKIILVSVFLVCLTSFTYSGTNIYLFLSANQYLKAGTEDDYEPGVNDFPIMEAHQVLGLGFGISSSTSGVLSFGIEGQYNNFSKASKASLVDPSDNDTVEIEAYTNIAGYLVFGLNIIRSTALTFYINAGGGAMFILGAEEKTYTSAKGYETIIEPPQKKISPAAFGGAGIIVGFSKAIALFANLRYTYIQSAEDPPRPQTGINALAGLLFRL